MAAIGNYYIVASLNTTVSTTNVGQYTDVEYCLAG